LRCVKRGRWHTYIEIGGLPYVTADQGKQIVEQLDSKL
jgi:hypothetical protein